MADVVDRETRSRMMSGIRGKDTKPEVLVRRALFAAGFRFRLHRKDLPGVPDIVLSERRVAVFVHGCFWHSHKGCLYARRPTSRVDFWKAKLDGNVERDRRAIELLTTAGWRVLVVWECLMRDNQALAILSQTLATWIGSAEVSGELSGGSTHA